MRLWLHFRRASCNVKGRRKERESGQGASTGFAAWNKGSKTGSRCDFDYGIFVMRRWLMLFSSIMITVHVGLELFRKLFRM